ncbi:MAG: nucleotidyltransferase domain-containing protein [Candidatus Marinimicrobia bacterium]|nr:nucleotidyltransferase domain-containing protein [Candidatus Neomarinimicrobiota bacterium]
MNRLEIISAIKKFKSENAKNFRINTLGVFGSASRDEIGVESDVDIIIETDTPDLFILVHIKVELEKILHHRVDIVRKRENMNPFLRKRIEKDIIYV